MSKGIFRRNYFIPEKFLKQSVKVMQFYFDLDVGIPCEAANIPCSLTILSLLLLVSISKEYTVSVILRNQTSLKNHIL